MKFALIVAVVLLIFSESVPAQVIDTSGSVVAQTTVYEVMTSPKTLAVCSAADIGTTIVAVSSGIGVEKNPLLAGGVNASQYWKMILSKLAVIGLFWWLYESTKPNLEVDVGLAVANVVTCGIAGHNALVILGR